MSVDRSMSAVTLVLPYPVSANRYWATRMIKAKKAGRMMAMTYVTSEAKAYKQEIGWRAKEAGILRPHEGRVMLEVKLYPKRPLDWAKRAKKDPECWDDDVQSIDLGNCEKVLSDALNGIAYIDDRQLRRIILDRMEPDGDARVVVTITPIPRKAINEGAP